MRIDLHRQRPALMHTLRRGDPVYQRVNPWHTGVIVRDEGAQGFTVKYTTGGKFWYPANRTGDFLVGTPTPEVLAQAQAPAMLADS